MRALARLRGWLSSALALRRRTAEDELRIAQNMRLALGGGVLGALLGAAANAACGKPLEAVPLVAMAAMLAAAWWLVGRGRLNAGALLGLGGMLLLMQLMLLTGGMGIHDRVALLYPVVILCAALLLDLRLLAATTAACALSVALVVWLEQSGRLQTPFTGRVGWLSVADTTIILGVTALAAHLLIADLLRLIAEARAHEASLAVSNRELAARSAELERFTYVVSHDLKSPLVTIRGFLGYVERDAREGDLTRLAADLGRIRGATDRMGRLLDDLLELSRTGRIDRPHADVLLLDLVRDARGLVEGRLAERGVRVEVEGPLPAVHGDPQRLVELLQNLLDNAAKFMGQQPDPPVWIAACCDEGGRVLVRVRDNGSGIDPAHHERVFELFQRLDPQQEGTGLGLAQARRIVEVHGGRMWVESEGAGHGSTFCFTLPPATGTLAGPDVSA